MAAVQDGRTAFAATVDAAHAAGAARDTARNVVPAAGPASAAATEALLDPATEISDIHVRRFFGATASIDSLVASESWQALQA